jgi:uncharacterized membrane protein
MFRSRLQKAARQIETAEVLDPVASLVQRSVAPLGRGAVGGVLRGEPIDHPLHPALIVVPIGSWLSASVLDLTGGDAKAARRLVGLGCLSALPTVAAGAADFLETKGEERRVGLVHALLNDVALGLYVASWRSRGSGRRVNGTLLALAGSSVLMASGWLGGHLAYRRGVGVDTSGTGSEDH